MKRNFGRHLTIRQKTLIDKFIRDNFNNIRKGEYYPIDDKYPEFMDTLNTIHCYENLPTDVERYIEDNLSKITRVGLGNPYLDMVDRMKEDIDKYATEDEKKILEGKGYTRLYVKQKKILDKFIADHYHDIKKGALWFSVEKFPELYDEVAAVRETETLWSDIDHYVSDKLMDMPWKNKHPWGDSVQKSEESSLLESKVLKTKSPLLKEEVLTEKWRDKLQNVYSDFEEFNDYNEIYSNYSGKYGTRRL
jgi:hypothetical protein